MSYLRKLAFCLVLALCMVQPAMAADEVNVSTGNTQAGQPLALHGYDPVAYFTDGKPVIGLAKYTVGHEGASYYLASEDHQKMFKANPAKYAPQYGGYCAYGVSVGKKFDGSPHYWTLRNDKLYLNLNADIANKISEDVDGYIKKAEKNWLVIKNKAVGKL